MTKDTPAQIDDQQAIELLMQKRVGDMAYHFLGWMEAEVRGRDRSVRASMTDFVRSHLQQIEMLPERFTK